MLVTTEAVVLRTVPHGDHTKILKAWTAHSGVRSYLVRTGNKRGVAPGALEPLARIELVADERVERDLFTVRELRVIKPYTNVPFDPVRGTLLLFAQEVFYKTLRTESADEELDAFVHHVLETIDTAADLACFPLVFLLQLSGHLGFYPEQPFGGSQHFDLQEGCFVEQQQPHGHTMGPPLSTGLIQLLDIDLHQLSQASVPTSLRGKLLDHLLLFFRLHVEGFGELRSVTVLRAVLH